MKDKIIVRELTDKQTATSREYLLSDGSHRIVQTLAPTLTRSATVRDGLEFEHKNLTFFLWGEILEEYTDPLNGYDIYFDSEIFKLVYLKAKMTEVPAGITAVKLRYEVTSDTAVGDRFGLYESPDAGSVGTSGTYLCDAEAVADNGKNYLDFDLWAGLKTSPSDIHHFSLFLKNQAPTYNLTTLSGVSASTPPRVMIDYVPESGVDYKQAYLEGDAGNAGKYRVNTRTGVLDFTKELIALGGELMPLAMSMTYDPYASGGDYAVGMPSGWKLNCQQFVYSDGADYAYIDGNYKKHTFKPLSGTDKYYDADHTGLVLFSAGTKIVIDDEKTGTLTFENGKLAKTAIRNGSAVTQTAINYNDSGMAVTDGMGRTATVAFDAGEIKITRPDGGIITMTVTDGRLVSLTEASGETHAYGYDADGNLTAAAAGYGRKAEFAYNRAKKVYTITESANGNSLVKYALSFRTGNTLVDETKYPAANAPVTKSTVYAYALNGEAIGTFETKDSNVSSIRFRSQEDFVRYNLYAAPEDSKAGEIYDGRIYGDSAEFSSFNLYALILYPPQLDKGEECVVSLVVDPDVTSAAESCDMNMGFSVMTPQPHAMKEFTRKIYRDGGRQTVTFRMSRDHYDNERRMVIVTLGEGFKLTASNVRVSKRPKINEIDCLNFGTDDSFRFTETDGGTNRIWHEAAECRIGTAAELVKMTKNDWLATMENRAKANGGNFVLRHSDLSGAVLVSPTTEITVELGEKRAQKQLKDIEYATVGESNTRTVFEHSVFRNAGAAEYAGRTPTAASGVYAADAYAVITTQNTVFADGTNKKCRLYYDAYYRLITTEDSEGAVTVYDYDAYGNMTGETVTADVPDETGAPKKMSIVRNSVYGDADGTGATGKYLVQDKDYFIGVTNIKKYKYDAATGDTKETISPKGLVTDFTYDQSGEPRTVSAAVDDKNNVNEFVYDTQGRLEKIKHNGFGYRFAYNGRDEVESVNAEHTTIGSDGQEVTDRVYPILHKVCSHKSTRDEVITDYTTADNVYFEARNTYDAYGRKIYTDTFEHDRPLDSQSNIYAAWNDEITNSTTPSSENLTINADSKLRKRIDNRRVSLYTYDNKGNVIHAQYTDEISSPAELLAETETVYDPDSRLSIRKDTVFGKATSAKFTYRNGDTLADDKIVGCSVKFNSLGNDYDESTDDVYDKLGRLRKRTRGLTVDLTPLFDEIYDYQYFQGPNSAKTTEYLEKVKCTYFDGSTTTYSYWYDNNSNISSIIYVRDAKTPENNAAWSVSYTYDDLDRLTIEDDNGKFKRYVYSYDAGGNIRTKEEYPFSQGSVGDLQKTIVYDYDDKWKDRLTTITEKDGSGNVLSVKTIGYDDRGKPTAYKGNYLTWKFDRLVQFGSHRYAYGCDNVRQRKIANGTTTTFCYEGSRLLGERRVTGGATVNIQYLYDHTGIIGFLMNEKRYKYTKDPLGNIVAVSGPDGSASYRYDAWGRCEILTNVGGIGDVNPFRYRGYYYDTETGLYYLINRYYDPEIGRFISPDHMGYMVEQMDRLNGCNLYAYCLNNPVMETDPEGTIPWWQKLLIGIGIVASTALFVAAIVASAGTVGALAGLGAASLGFSATTVSTMATVATIGTYVVAGGVALFGVSDAVEVWSGGTNPIRDWVMGGNQTAYNVTRGVFSALGSVAVLAGTFGPKFLKGSGPRGYKKDFFDRNGKWSARLDATTHGNPKWHHNPHVHFGARGGGGQGIYYWWEIIRRFLKL